FVRHFSGGAAMHQLHGDRRRRRLGRRGRIGRVPGVGRSGRHAPLRQRQADGRLAGPAGPGRHHGQAPPQAARHERRRRLRPRSRQLGRRKGHMHAVVFAALFAAIIPTPRVAGDGSQRVVSPNKRIEVAVWGGERIHYDVFWDGKPLVTGARLSMDIDHVRLGTTPQLVNVRRRTVDWRIEPPIQLKAATLPERYNELRLEYAGGFAVVFRAYDEGVGYRFETDL